MPQWPLCLSHILLHLVGPMAVKPYIKLSPSKEHDYLTSEEASIEVCAKANRDWLRGFEY